MKKLSGLPGAERMARSMVRAQREPSRDNYVFVSKDVDPSASGEQKSKITKPHAEPWARKFVPGWKDSGLALPASTTRVGLTCPPGRNNWVAEYRNREHQDEQRKRPTRSMKWGFGKPTFAGFGSLATHQAGMQRSSRSCHIAAGYHLGQMDIGYDAAKSGPSTCAATTATSTKRPSSSRALLQCRCLVVCLQYACCLSSPRSRYVANPFNAFTSSTS